MVSAGTTARAELRLPDGTHRPALRVAGRYFGWYSTAGGNKIADLVAYDTGGAVEGHMELSLRSPPR
ncbi:hypothetical protein AB0J80_27895 [Actinoplanes sp. NPDC049548]|uniref:hypothetical protein n=1 Tax=Actinoplanes sp. NPDC049548 TaxID=3155152 RepID=UPI0034355F22